MSTSVERAAPSSLHERIIVALDVPDAGSARSIIDELSGEVGAFKIGLQLFTSAGPAFVREVVEKGHRVFLDLKFHDIPNTVAAASIEAAKLGVWMFNVHCSGGKEMMSRTVSDVTSFCRQKGIDRPNIIGVTVLTSSSPQMLNDIGVIVSTEEQVQNLAKLALESGLDGVVCSPLEVPIVRSAVADPSFITVTPGIRSGTATNDDQKRVTTFGTAVTRGSDFVVIGRPITYAADRRKAVHEIIAEAEAEIAPK
jgi:orotidine-5'-phosphate decarboxylase